MRPPHIDPALTAVRRPANDLSKGEFVDWSVAAVRQHITLLQSLLDHPEEHVRAQAAEALSLALELKSGLAQLSTL
jgi:hypothetical protein